ncbi:MAG: imidazole glycerol phosphate synthase subunit HisH [Polyangiaceae bacterium]
MSSTSVVVVDLGMGNVRSVIRSLRESVGGDVDVELSSNPDVIRAASRIVVPGQGAFRDASTALQGSIGDVLRERITARVPYLGICLGLQVLFEGSDEAPGAPGLGVIPGKVALLAATEGRPAEEKLKLPHMGWNQVDAHGPSELAASLHGQPWFYFVHSFHAVPDDRSVVAGTCTHGAAEVVAAVATANIWATQFHPEKSDRAGLELLRRFLTQNVVR